MSGFSATTHISEQQKLHGRAVYGTTFQLVSAFLKVHELEMVVASTGQSILLSLKTLEWETLLVAMAVDMLYKLTETPLQFLQGIAVTSYIILHIVKPCNSTKQNNVQAYHLNIN